MAKPAENKKLERYREEMRELTRSILDLVRARQDLSLKIAASKRAQGLAVEDKRVEARLIADVKEHATKIGLDEDVAESIGWKLIESSKISQRKDTYLEQVRSFLKSENIRSVSIVGAGRMGGWFARYFQLLGVRVVLYDENRSRSVEKAKSLGCETAKSISSVASSDLAILAVPISATPKGIGELIEIVGSKRKIRIIEVSSVKSGIANSGMLDGSKIPANIEIYSIHPLFGSNVNHFSANNIVQVNQLDTDFIERLFPHFRVFKMNWEAHDRLMGLMLSLPHSLALIFADLLVKNAENIPKGMGSPSYDRMVDLAGKVLGESPSVYFEIQSLNPNSEKILDDALKSLGKFKELTKDKPGFTRFFETSRRIENKLNDA
ncbi:MAG: bifunctional chorismate mutase/prephenate dehydrogenase [Bacteroidetes bacterium]|nr:bifunctional chorismate mutase/prephenate dehydrogenase [Bacteroidota bacterium]